MKKLASLLLVGFGLFIGMISVTNVFGETIKIGAIWELTGPGSSWGIPCKKVVDLQAIQINEKGGIKVGDKRYLIEFITEDGKCTSSDAITAVNKLIFRDRVKFLVGPVCSASAAAVAPILEENKVLATTTACGTDKWFSSETKYTFRTGLVPVRLQNSILQWIADNFKDIKRVGFINRNDETGKTGARYNLPALNEVNSKSPGRFEHAGSDWFELGTEDFRPPLMRLLSKKPDLIFTGPSPAEMALIIKQSRELGYKGYFYAIASVHTKQLVQIAGKENCERVMQSGMDWEATPKMKNFYNAYKAHYGEAPLDIGGYVIDGLPLMVQAIEEAGSFDVDKVVKVLESWKKIDSYSGEARWGGLKTYGVKHQLCRPFPVTMIRDGRDVVIGNPLFDYP